MRLKPNLTTHRISSWMLISAIGLLPACTPGAGDGRDADIVVSGISEKPTIAAGEEATFHVTVSNKGPNDAAHVHVLDKVGNQSTVVSMHCAAQGKAACPATLGPDMTLDSLPKDGVLEFVVVAKLSDPQGTGTIMNSVSATAIQDNNPNDNSINIDVMVR